MRTKIPAASRISPAPKPLITKNITKQQAINTVSNLLYSAGLDVDSKVIKRQSKGELVNVLNMASLISRQSMQSMLGQSFNGKRDLYEVVGWKKELFFDDYLMMYERNGIAAAVVDIKADESWREFFVLHDGKTADDWQDDTPFLKAWLDLTERLDLQSKFHELDTALGIGRFAIMVIGVQGDNDYSKELKQGGTKTISFIKVLDEGQITLSEPVSNVTDPRYGLPRLYRCTFEEGGASVPVHWTRVIHFKQGRGRSSVYGVPGLQKSFNSLMDLEKVSASSSEAFWQHIRRVLVLMAREGFATPAPGTPEYEKLQDKMDSLEHQMRQVVQLNNMDIEKLESTSIDGKAQHDLIIEDVAGTNRIPQRILTGSERGELASSQDILNMNNATAARQKKVCTPWARDAVKHFYVYGFIPAPSSGKFQIEWNSLYQMTPEEKIDLGIKKAQFLEAITGGNIEQAMRVEDLVADTLDGYVLPEAEEPIEKEGAEDVTDEEPKGEGVELAQGLADDDKFPFMKNGGKGSGNHGHKGRPGERGGSGKGTGFKFHVYHGTNSDFDKFSTDFSTNWHSKAIGLPLLFFSDSTETASTYGDNIVEAEIEMENPLLYDAEGREWVEVIDDVKQKFTVYESTEHKDFVEYRDFVFEKYPAMKEWEDWSEYASAEEIGNLTRLSKEYGNYRNDVANGTIKAQTPIPVYDGIIMKNVLDQGLLPVYATGAYTPHATVYAVIDAKQIKILEKRKIKID